MEEKKPEWRLYRKDDKVAHKDRPKFIGTIKQEGRLYPQVKWPGEQATWVWAGDLILIKDNHPDLSNYWKDKK